MASVVLLLAFAATLIRLGLPQEDGGFVAAGTAADGNAVSDVVLPELTGEVAWATSPGAGPEAVVDGPWAAPVLTDREVVVSTPGQLLWIARDGRTPVERRVELPVAGTVRPALLDPAAGIVAVPAIGALWWVHPQGVLLRGADRGLADVAPVALGQRVLVQTRLGGLQLLEDVGRQERSVASLRGLDVATDPADVPRFELRLHAVTSDGVWVGVRGRSSGQWSLWLLDATNLDVRTTIALGTTDVPTLAVLDDDGGEQFVVVAHDEVVRRVGRDGATVWSALVGDDAELLGAWEGLVASRSATSRVSFDAATGRQVSRGTVTLVDGPRSEVFADEVLVNSVEEGLVAIGITFSTVTRRLAGEPVSVAAHDDRVIAWVARDREDGLVLRLVPTPDRSPIPDGGGARDVALATGRGCRVAALGDHLVWHDGMALRTIDPDDGSVLARIEAASSARSTLAVHRDQLHVVDDRGFVRRYDTELDLLDALPLGEDPVPGVAVTDVLVIGAGGTGTRAPVAPASAFVQGLRPDGRSAFLVRLAGAVAATPVARGDRVAVRDREGRVTLLDEGRVLATVEGTATTVDAPVLTPRGIVLRDGDDVVGLFPRGEEVWRAAVPGSLPSPVATEAVVAVRVGDGVAGIDRATGIRIWDWTSDSGSTPKFLASIGGGAELVVVVDGTVTVLDAATGEAVRTTEVATTVTVEEATGGSGARTTRVGRLVGAVLPTSVGIIGCTTHDRVVLVR